MKSTYELTKDSITYIDMRGQSLTLSPLADLSDDGRQLMQGVIDGTKRIIRISHKELNLEAPHFCKVSALLKNLEDIPLFIHECGNFLIFFTTDLVKDDDYYNSMYEYTILKTIDLPQN